MHKVCSFSSLVPLYPCACLSFLLFIHCEHAHVHSHDHEYDRPDPAVLAVEIVHTDIDFLWHNDLDGSFHVVSHSVHCTFSAAYCSGDCGNTNHSFFVSGLLD